MFADIERNIGQTSFKKYLLRLRYKYTDKIKF